MATQAHGIVDGSESDVHDEPHIEGEQDHRPLRPRMGRERRTGTGSGRC